MNPDMTFLDSHGPPKVDGVDAGAAKNAANLSLSFQTLIEQVNDLVIITDTAYEHGGPFVVYVNEAYESLTGYDRREVIGKRPGFLDNPERCPEAVNEIQRALRNSDSGHTEMMNHTRDGRPYWVDLRLVPLTDDNGVVHHFAAIERDITARKETEQKLQRLATTDPLTGTTSRGAFLDATSRAIRTARQNQEHLSLIMMDVDDFKAVNDGYGHAAGDEVLKEVADAGRRCIRDNDAIGRIGGEEFAVMLHGIDGCQAEKIAERLRSEIANRSIQTRGKTVSVTISCGVTQLHDSPRDDSEAILRRADQALYSAKGQGRNCTRTNHEAGDGI